MKKLCAVLVAGLLLIGCSTPSPNTQPIVPIVPAVDPFRTNVQRVAVCIGLTSVDPNAYQGWSGSCPGCNVDAKGMYSLFTRNGIDSLLMLNKDATWTNIKSVIATVTKDFKRGDLLFISMSGHGGQIPDDNGDEADKLDETICLWSGQVRDDDVLTFLMTLPAGLRIVLINDQCHSEGNFRAFVRKITFGKLGKSKGKALIKKSMSRDPAISLIQFAGCREANYSYGAPTGGTWTQSLLSTFKPELTWKQWFDAAKKIMPSNQEPVWVEFGNVTDEFRNGAVLK